MMGRFYRANPKKVSKLSRLPKFQSFSELFICGSFLCFVIILFCSYSYTFPFSDKLVVNKHNSSNSTYFLSKGCNVFDGKWVINENYPLYNASECPFLEQGFDCLGNGRKDGLYQKWRWNPNGCQLPKFEAHFVLELLRGKRVVFVGDSLSRTQWESMICMLISGVEHAKSVYEVNGNEITKKIRHLAVRFDEFELTIEFYRSVFLVSSGVVPRHSPKRVRRVVKLDQMDGISREWIDSDILVFNSGHWWNPTKLFDMYVHGKIKLGLTINSALKIALSTWKSWIERTVNPTRTRVFFRTFESTHWSKGSRENCRVSEVPTEGKESSSSPISDTIIDVIRNTSIPVEVLHVTPMGWPRSDAHVGSWSDNPLVLIAAIGACLECPTCGTSSSSPSSFPTLPDKLF